MKKSLVIFLFCLLSLSSGAQKYLDKDFLITRIPLKEKFNLPARNFPRLIIKAYCEGKIQGFFPYRPQQECSYHEFVSHFTLSKAQPVVKGDAFENVACPLVFCMNDDDESVEPFCFYYDIIEEKQFSTQASKTANKIKYVRLVFVKEKQDAEAYYMGPVFLYEDLISLSGADYFLLNPKNEGAKISIKHYLEGRIFTGFSLIPGGRPPGKKNNPNSEHDKWDN